jgi:hypothetical protein
MKLVVVWKSAIETDITKFILPYAYNSKLQGWFDEVEVLIWGASQEAVALNPDYMDQIKHMNAEGIKFHACKMCSDSLGVSEILESLGVNVMYTGVYLSDAQKDPDTKVITL